MNETDGNQVLAKEATGHNTKWMVNKTQSSHQTDGFPARSSTEIQTWIVGRLAQELQTSRETLKVDQPILSYGIDSVQILTVMTELEDWGGFRFSGNPLDDYPTAQALAQYVADLTGKTP